MRTAESIRRNEGASARIEREAALALREKWRGHESFARLFEVALELSTYPTAKGKRPSGKVKSEWFGRGYHWAINDAWKSRITEAYRLAASLGLWHEWPGLTEEANASRFHSEVRRVVELLDKEGEA